MKNKAADKRRLYRLDGKTGGILDGLIEKYMLEDWSLCEKAHRDIMNIILQAGIGSNISLYVFDKLTEAVIKMQVHNKNLHTVLKRLAFLKIYIWILPLMRYDEEIRKGYFDSLYALGNFTEDYFKLLEPVLERAAENNRADMVSEILYIRVLLLTYSCELPPIYDMWPEKRLLHTKCNNCGEDLRTVLFTGDKSEAKVEERQYEEPCGAVINIEPWDIFTKAFNHFGSFSDVELFSVLKRLYGKRKCIHCGDEEIVMDTYMSWWRSEYRIADIDPKLIDWLNEMGSKLLAESVNYKQGLFYFEQALCYAKGLSAPQPVRLSECFVNISCAYNFLYKFDFQILYAEKAVAVLEEVQVENSDKYKLALAESYRRLGVAYSADFMHKENNRPKEAMEAYNKAKAIFDEVLGEHNYKSELIEANIAVSEPDLKASYGDEEQADFDADKEQETVKNNINNLIGQIEREEKKPSPDLKKIAENCNIIAYIYACELGDYSNACKYYEGYIAYNKKRYGEENGMVADCYNQMAEYHEQAGDIKGACKYYEMALDINIREMGRLYMLPSIFKRVTVGMMNAAGKLDRDDKFNRSMSAAASYSHVGRMYIDLGEPKNAIKALKKSIALIEWELSMPTSEKAYAHMLAGEAYMSMENLKNAKKEYSKALQLYIDTANNNMKSGSPIFESDTERCKKYIPILKEKLKNL